VGLTAPHQMVRTGRLLPIIRLFSRGADRLASRRSSSMGTIIFGEESRREESVIEPRPVARNTAQVESRPDKFFELVEDNPRLLSVEAKVSLGFRPGTQPPEQGSLDGGTYWARR
jgi:hypothetical protein